jgi:hypothetical protein
MTGLICCALASGPSVGAASAGNDASVACGSIDVACGSVVARLSVVSSGRAGAAAAVADDGSPVFVASVILTTFFVPNLKVVQNGSSPALCKTPFVYVVVQAYRIRVNTRLVRKGFN